VVPSLGGQGLREDVGDLLLGVDILQGYVRVPELLIGAGQVYLVRAADVSELGAASLTDDLDGGLVVLEDFEVYIATEDVTPQL
jgi:hypothetical protein